MIQLPRSFLRQVRNLLRKAFGRTLPAVMIQSSFTGLAVRCQYDGIAVLYQSREGQGDDSLFLPGQALADIEGKNHDIVALEAKDNKIAAHWTDAGVPRRMQYQAGKADAFNEFPQTPTRFTQQAPDYCKRLDEAMQTASKDAIRLALNKIQLRGEAGMVVATDGHQLLRQSGFQFPFTEDILIPRTNVLQCKEFAGNVEIAKSKTHFCVRCEPWTIFFLIDKEARFPNVDSIIPKVDANSSHVRLSQQDVSFLSNALPRLPGGEDSMLAVTLELNGKAIVRAKDDKQSTEVVLSGAGVSGKQIRYALNRQNLARALELGFTDGYVFDVDKPMLFQDDRRTLVFTGLGKDHVVLHSPSDVCLSSDSSDTKSHQHPALNSRRNEPMKASRPPAKMVHDQSDGADLSDGHDAETNGVLNGNGNGQHPKAGFSALLEETQSIQNGLRDLLLRTNHLMVGLKSYRRQAKTVQSTLDSLRQLQQVQA